MNDTLDFLTLSHIEAALNETNIKQWGVNSTAATKAVTEEITLDDSFFLSGFIKNDQEEDTLKNFSGNVKENNDFSRTTVLENYTDCSATPIKTVYHKNDSGITESFIKDVEYDIENFSSLSISEKSENILSESVDSLSPRIKSHNNSVFSEDDIFAEDSDKENTNEFASAINENSDSINKELTYTSCESNRLSINGKENQQKPVFRALFDNNQTKNDESFHLRSNTASNSKHYVSCNFASNNSTSSIVDNNSLCDQPTCHFANSVNDNCASGVSAIDNSKILIHDKYSLTSCNSENGVNKFAYGNAYKSDDTKIFLQDKHALTAWGLPETIISRYKARNITHMFDWQVECLTKHEVLKQNGNLIYSAPTSAGKTLVAEILAIKCLLERKKKVIFILPFISVVREKMFYFQDILSSSGIRVEGFMGSYNPPGGFQSIQMAIGTIEKCNSLINKLLEEQKLSDIGVVIIDEIHLIGDSSRGYLLELLLTKLMYQMKKAQDVKIQLVGMSATLPNLDLLSSWLDAELYTTTFRPIPLNEQLYVNKEIYDTNFKLVRRLQSLPDLTSDTDDILQLCLETLKESCSVLIFCPTKNWCENLAMQIALAFFKLGKTHSELGQLLRASISPEKILETLEHLKLCPSGLDAILKKTVAFGVAFHHAGLTMEERDIIEGGFKCGNIRILIATSTLSSGVNLPARRVIIRTPVFHGKPIDILSYRQMIGRAGRMGIDSAGESILICQKNDYNVAKSLMSVNLRAVHSCLDDLSKFKRAVLEIIASGVATTPEDLTLFENSTLLFRENMNDEDTEPVKRVVEFLKKYNFIRLQVASDDSAKYIPTALGKACLSSSIAPEEGLELFMELEKARRCLVLETELHLIYLVTPYSACYQWGNIDWMFYLNLWERLPLGMKKVGELVGIRESFLVNATRGNTQTSSQKLIIHKRFFIALALQDLVNEISLDEVARKFNCNRGMLQSLQQSASTFAGMITSFSKQLGWSSVELLISQFQDRLQFGISRELLDLMRLPIINSKQARALFNSGIETLTMLANSDVCTIENILHKMLPFESTTEREGESEYDVKQRNKLRKIWVTGKHGLTEREAAQMILDESRKFLEIELGVSNVNWGHEHSDSVIPSESSDETGRVLEVERVLETERISQTEGLLETETVLETERVLEAAETSKSTRTKSLKLNDTSFSKLDQLFSPKLLLSPKSPKSNRLFSPRSPHFKSKFKLSQQQSLISHSLGNKRNNSNISPHQQTPRKKKRPDSLENPDISCSYPDSSSKNSVPVDMSKLELINVTKSPELFETFCQELKQQTAIGLSLGCTRCDIQPFIGLNLNQNDTLSSESNIPSYVDGELRVDTVAVTWDGKTAFYIPTSSILFQSKGISFLQNILDCPNAILKMFDSKSQITLLKKVFMIKSNINIEDPKIADWLLDPDGQERSLYSMVLQFCPEVRGLVELSQSTRTSESIALHTNSSVDSRIRAAVEVVATWHLLDSMKTYLEEVEPRYLDIFGLEMEALRIVITLEQCGIGVNKNAMEELIDLIKNQMSDFERKIFSATGRKFSLNSSKEVAKVLKLNTNGRVSTKKKVLEQNDNPLSDFILTWRKLNHTNAKILFPLLATVANNRIYGKCITHNSTGRITMQDPNVQNVPKYFEIHNPISNELIKINCRGLFIPRKHHVMLSVDYCQLEFRLLTHLSQDSLLCSIMKSDEDIFRMIAAKWNHIDIEEVTEAIRNQTKQICYGIIYGMGSKALSDQLKMDEEEADILLENFKNTYPGIKKFIEETLEKAKLNGYVETISGRRRYLPHIKDDSNIARKHAERQAVNSTIQGSAADLVKKAMINVENTSYQFRKMGKPTPLLVLHLHDELIYEVPNDSLKTWAKVIKSCMESSVQLSIPFPVKVKSGKTWGEMTELCDI